MDNYLDDLRSRKSKFKEEDHRLENIARGVRFEKSDEKALIIAALTTILPVVFISCLLFYVVIAFVFRIN